MRPDAGAPATLVVLGHGSRCAEGVAEFWELLDKVKALLPGVECAGGFIELAQPTLAEALDGAAARGATEVVGVPLVLLGAGHLKQDGADAVAGANGRWNGSPSFRYARELGVHPSVVSLAAERGREALSGAGSDGPAAVVLVGRGSTDPDANSDLFKVARLIEDPYGCPPTEAAFVSLSPPSVPEALERCRRLGARRIAVVPYFLFDGVLVRRISAQVAEWAARSPGVQVAVAAHLGAADAVAGLVAERYWQAVAGDVRMSCDMCSYRVRLPGYD